MLKVPVFLAHNSTFFFLVNQVAYRQFQYVVSIMLRTLDYKHVQKRGKLLQLSLTPPSICYHQMFYFMPIFSRHHWKQYLLCTKFSKICCKLLIILPLCLYHICIFFLGGEDGVWQSNNIKCHFTTEDKCGSMLLHLTIALELRLAHTFQKTQGHFGTP